MAYNFFALISRMKHVFRWGLMRNSLSDNLAEHSHMTAVLAHALGVIRRDVFGEDCDPNLLAAAALYHDASELLTGDLPTPIKYADPTLTKSYKAMERDAAKRLAGYLPEAMRPAYAPLLCEQLPPRELELLKAADKLAAHIKCLEELRAGNGEFRRAEEQTRQAVDKLGLKEVDYFRKNFMPSFGLTLDEIGE